MPSENLASRKLLELLDHPKVVEHLAGYFAQLDDGRPQFTGARFETLGGRGDTPMEVANGFTAADLVAVTTLSVSVPAEAAIWMLGVGAAALSEHLDRVPVDAEPQTEPGQRLLRERDGPLWQLWKLLKSQHDIGWVTAGKLCARKRPRLAPIYDEHVETAVGKPDSWWVMIADAFLDPALTDRLDELHAEAGVPEHVSRLRVLDTAIWMRQHGHKWLR